MPNWSQFQYSTVKYLIGNSAGKANWVPEGEQERILAYQKYEEIYFSDPKAFQLQRRGIELEPIMVPNAKLICDNTAHYLLKGMKLTSRDKGLMAVLTPFLKREKFYSRFQVAKHSGVVRGDWIMHMTADPSKPAGKRVCMNSVDPAAYFPEFDSDNLDEVIAVTIANLFKDDDGTIRIHRLRYELIDVDGGKTGVTSHEAIFEVDEGNWLGLYGDKPRMKRELLAKTTMPSEIEHIPVYHFKNADWQGQPFGSSELRGYERLMAGVNQTISDTEVALALEGLGVYATDSGSPVDDNGNKVAWEIAPGRVMELPLGGIFKRVDGIKSLDPVTNFVEYLDKSMAQSSSTFLAGEVDVQVAQSGIALAIRFLPTLAKVEERDNEGIDVSSEMWEDWKLFEQAYEGEDFVESEIDIVLGEKLPIDRKERVAELNNMLDRNIISRQYYREKMMDLGYEFPDDAELQKQIEDELTFLAQFKISPNALGEPEGAPGEQPPLASGNPDNPNEPSKAQGSTSNNAKSGKVNESSGSESGRSGPSKGSGH